MLPQDMFLNLIDTELQNRIALSDDLDGIVAESLKLLLAMAPTSMTTIPRWSSGLWPLSSHHLTYHVTHHVTL